MHVALVDVCGDQRHCQQPAVAVDDDDDTSLATRNKNDAMNSSQEEAEVSTDASIRSA